MRGNAGAAGGIQQESYAAQGHCRFIAHPDPSLAFRFPKVCGTLQQQQRSCHISALQHCLLGDKIAKTIMGWFIERGAGYPEGAAPKAVSAKAFISGPAA